MNKRYLLLLLALLLSLTYAPSGFGQLAYAEQKTFEPSRGKGNNYGGHVRIYDDFAFVQAYDAGPKGAGRVYVYTEDNLGQWVLHQILESAVGYKGDHFGSNMERSDSTMAFAANMYGTSNKGAVFIFELNREGKWVEKQKLSSYRSYDTGFGVDVAMSGDYIIVGAYSQQDGPAGSSPKNLAGAAYIYKRAAEGNFQLHQEIFANNREAGAYFGHTVFMDGNTAAVGAIYDSYDACEPDSVHQAGAVFIYELDEDGQWNFKQELSQADRQNRDFFGHEIFIQENEMFVTATRHAPTNGFEAQGVIYYFQKNAKNGLWCEKQQIKSPEAAKRDYFGHSIAVKGNVMVTGTAWWMKNTKGAAMVFVKNKCNEWVYTQKITAFDGKSDDSFGRYVGISDKYILVGSCDNDFAEPNSTMIWNGGAAYFYKISAFDATTLPCNSSNATDAPCKPCESTTNIVDASYDIPTNPQTNPVDTTSNVQNQPSPDSTEHDILPVDITVSISVENCKTVLTANEQNASYQWVDCETGKAIPGANSRKFIPTQDGSYAVELKNADSEGSSHCFDVKVRVEQSTNPNVKPEFSISPNPNNGSFELTIIGHVSGTYHVVIKSPFGMLIKEIYVTEKVTLIELGSVSFGTYLVKVTQNGLSSTLPMLVKANSDGNDRN